MIKILPAIILLMVFTFGISAVELKKLGEIPLALGDQILHHAASFCVSEREVIFVTDSKMGDIKIFDNAGKLISVWGHKGPGPNEFLKPFGCTCDKNRFVLIDFMKRKTFLFQVRGKHELVLEKTIKNPKVPGSLVLRGDELLVAGINIDADGKEYELYNLNLVTGSKTNLLPIEKLYGFETYAEYRTNFRNKPEIGLIGSVTWCARSNDTVYAAWLGSLDIKKIDIKTGSIKTFGKETAYYVTPMVSDKMLNAYKHGNRKLFLMEREKLSIVKGIFAGNGYMGVIYSSPKVKDGGSYPVVQLYTHNGTFLKEFPIVDFDAQSFKFFLQSQGDVLYFMVSGLDENDEDFHKLVRYKIVNANE